ncbi:MAG TPA: TPM domain-containing protein [Puia sp.]|nr:TPM domain-containing protein [Puia sp.]
MRIPFTKKDFFTQQEKNQIVAAIQAAERQTSGEIRVYVESHCRFVDPLDRAAEVFWNLKMDQTAQRNAVLLYVAIKDRQLALLGDKGIHEKVGDLFWNEKVKQILSHMQRGSYADSIAKMVGEVGDALHLHFPYNRDTDVNELPDDIVFGR